MVIKKRIIFSLFSLGLLSITFAQYRCDWNVVSNGGMRVTAENLAAMVSVGQPAVGVIQNSNLVATIGFWVIEAPVTGMKEEKLPIKNMVLKTRLFPISPNPFSNQTKITYSLAAESDVTFLIYNLSGQIVRRFFIPHQKPGVYSFRFNGRDERERRLPEGIYFYKFFTPDYQKGGKFLLMR